MYKILILIIMSVGVFIGFKFFPEKYSNINSNVQLVCTAVLIFSMGVSLGNREGFIKELGSLGYDSFIFAIIPIICSVILVFILSKKFMEGKDDTGRNN